MARLLHDHSDIRKGKRCYHCFLNSLDFLAPFVTCEISTQCRKMIHSSFDSCYGGLIWKMFAHLSLETPAPNICLSKQFVDCCGTETMWEGIGVSCIPGRGKFTSPKSHEKPSRCPSLPALSPWNHFIYAD